MESLTDPRRLALPIFQASSLADDGDDATCCYGHGCILIPLVVGPVGAGGPMDKRPAGQGMPGKVDL